MKTVLCFGDSNTWGYIPAEGSRFPFQVRWTGNLQHRLGARVRIIEEGLNGRTTVWNEPFRPGRNGLKALRPLLESHAPVDLLVLFLGTNDLKHFYNATAVDSARGIATLIDEARSGKSGASFSPDELVVISPPVIGPLSPEMGGHFVGAEQKSKLFASAYAEICEREGCLFIDSARTVNASPRDGIHLDADEHDRLAARLEPVVSEILGV